MPPKKESGKGKQGDDEGKSSPPWDNKGDIHKTSSDTKTNQNSSQDDKKRNVSKHNNEEVGKMQE